MILILVSVLCSACGVFFVCRYATSLGLVDIPGQRSSHRQPTPKGGGLGIVLAFFLSHLWLDLPLLVSLSALGIAITGFIADRSDFSPRIRLMVFFLCAGLFLSSQGGSNHPVALLLFACSLVFIVGTANFYNFMDGINGMAGLSGMVCFSLLGLYGALLDKNDSLVMVCFAIAAACLGFLPFNIPGARIFMGDVGSVFLGFMFSAISVVFSENLFEFSVLASFLILFYMDELTTMVQRLRAGKSLLQPHRMHLYQVLANEAACAQWRVSLGYAVIQLLCGGVGIWCYRNGQWGLWVAILALCSLVFIGVDLFVKNKFSIRVSV
nr:hypothetical protein [uncultured Desulfuromonas sp.]